MSKHNETGANGEQLAANFLKNAGYEILHLNWRSGKKEVDIIAQKGDCTVFAEVKTRTASYFGFPEEAVKPAKQLLLKQAAEAYCEMHKSAPAPRFDVISVLLLPGQAPEIIHFADAFY